MSSGDTLLILTPENYTPPTTLYPDLDKISGGSTPAEYVSSLAFDDTTQEYGDFMCIMPAHYSGSGITLTLVWSAIDVSTDVVEWNAAFRRIEDDTDDIGTSHSYTYNTSSPVTAPTVNGEVAYDNITFTNGADMDSVVAGDYFILRVSRDPTPSSGVNCTDDAYIHAIHVKET